jgi:hypothetical protein
MIVPRNRASMLVDPTASDTSEVSISTDGSRAMVPLGWVLECLATNKLVSLQDYVAENA